MIGNKKAFTLIELLVVVLIIGILSAIALPQYNFAVEKSRLAEAMTNAASLQKAVNVWALENGYPTGSICFLGDNCAGKGQLAIDLETGMDCNAENGLSCSGKNFMYSVTCYWNQSCSISVTKKDYAYSVNWQSISESWHGHECIYPDDSPIGEKICKMLEAQGNGFFACENC